MSGATLTLSQQLAIALVPSSVPAMVLLLALAIAIGIGELPEALGEAFEQIAGGALLITYMKELLPKVMAQGDAAVEYVATGKPAKAITRTKIWTTLLMVACISASAIAQSAAAGFPGMHHNTTESGSADAKPKFTPASTIAYFIGFFVDGVVLAYDENPVRCDVTLVKKLVMSLVFAIDNLLDGFGLCPVLKEAFGDEVWWVVMIIFSGCVLAGATFTACLRYFVPNPVFHLVWLSLATTSILVGALELMQHGLSVFVMVGIAAVWIVLFVGDLVSEEDDGGGDGAGGGDAEGGGVRLSLELSRHSKFVDVVQQRKAAQSRWKASGSAARLLLAARGAAAAPPGGKREASS